ncbi:MAG TPA: hypothetical protein VJZ77_22120, partial [Blastocatellia bacterium]|nr:hypothetical protein [Blastocatellia bacterium]
FDAAFPSLDLSKARFTTGKAASKPPHSKASHSFTLNLMPLALKRRAKIKCRSAAWELISPHQMPLRDMGIDFENPQWNDRTERYES